jgi:DNA repair ATPase RecN
MEADLKQYQEDAKRLGDDFERVSKELDNTLEENSKLKTAMAQSVEGTEQNNVLLKDLGDRIESLKVDRDNKAKYLDNMIKENATLKAQIEELETKNKELEDANLQLAEAEADSSDKASKLEVLVEQLKEELAKVYEDQDNPPVTSSQEYTVETAGDSEVIVESNEEEEDDGESEIFFMNAVYCTLETIVESTGKKTDYKYYDGTDIPKDTRAIVFRDDNGAFLVDADEKLFVGINLSKLEFPEDDLEESKEE